MKPKISSYLLIICMIISVFSVSSGSVNAAKKKITLNKTKITLNIGQTYKLKPKVKPVSLAKKVKYSSSNETIAKVTKKGKISAISTGKAKIYAKIKGTRLKAICVVTVNNPGKNTPTDIPPNSGSTNNLPSANGTQIHQQKNTLDNTSQETDQTGNTVNNTDSTSENDPNATATASPGESGNQDHLPGDIYVSPDGKSSGTGTSTDPMDVVTAIAKIPAGNTIWCKSGSYKLSDTIIISEDISGNKDAYKKLSSVNSETVTFDFTGMDEESSNRGFVLDGSYWHFYGVDITGAGDNGMLLSGDNNIIEMCQFYSNHDTGLQVSRYNSKYTEVSQWPSYNLIKNCTAFNNKDDETTENADGFAAKLTCGNGNVFDGCIAYCNSDDGWDLYAKTATGSIGVVTIKNCVAFGNGKLTNGEGSANGDMNGFKLGGSNGQCPTDHIIHNCLAFYNGTTGFTDNGNGGAIKMTNCTAVDNGKYNSSKANFMCYRTSADSTYTNIISYYTSGSVPQSDKFLGKMTTSIYAYKSTGYYLINSGSFDGNVTKQNNLFNISNSSFKSINVPGYSSGFFETNYHTVFRDEDGSLNMNGLFEYIGDGVGAKF